MSDTESEAGSVAAPPAPEAAPAKPERMSAKTFSLNILNGLALGIVIALIPGALFGEISKALLPVAPWLSWVIFATGVATSSMGLVVGYVIGQLFKMTPIQSASIGMAVFFAAGAVKQVPKSAAFSLAGAGDIITMGITAAICVGLIKLMGAGLKAYAIIVYPLVLTVVGGIIGRLILPYSLKITEAIGKGVQYLTGLQPYIMGILIAVVFSILIMTPITTVGVALAISLVGIGSGAGNIGVCAAGFGFCMLGWKVNSHGTALAHVIGSPKMSMANMIKKPKIMLPIICAAAVSGLFGVLLGIKGTPMSAGFGISGLVGPLGFFSVDGWSVLTVVKALIAFIALPFATNYVFAMVFKRLGIIKDQDYYLDI